MPKELMSPGFAVFNLHLNDAGENATAEFIRMFGRAKYDKHIKPYEGGIMAILNVKPNKYILAWIAMVTVLVNEDRNGLP